MANSERTETPSAATTTTTAQSAAASAATAPASATRADAEDRRGQPPGPKAAATPLEAVTISSTNAHYHASREAFLDTEHRWFMFLVIALGAAALTDALPKLVNAIFGIQFDPILFKEGCAAAAAIIAALDLTFDLSNRARNHAMMRRRYFELLANIREGHKTPEQGRVCLDEFSADEEPAYRVLYLSSWNAAQKTVFGNNALKIRISFWANIFKNWWRRPSYPVVVAKTQ